MSILCFSLHFVKNFVRDKTLIIPRTVEFIEKFSMKCKLSITILISNLVEKFECLFGVLNAYIDPLLKLKQFDINQLMNQTDIK